GDRGPQVYTLSAGNNGKDGWKQIAQVDTRPQSGNAGGQYGVSISDSTGSLGRYRYLLFDISCTEKKDPFGNTFFSELDVIEAGGPAPELVALPAGHVEIVETEGGQYRFAVDTSETPDLTDWTHTELAPVLREWYPRLVKLLASEGYAAPRNVQIVFSADMKGVAATGGTRVSCAAKWYRQSLKGEAKGSPGWVTEGIADYVRWFLYEPQSHGAEISPRAAANARYDASYRTTANFLNWVVTKYDPELVTRLNAAARTGTYTEAFWKQRTGHTVQELTDAWKAALAKN
ncbi:MAG: basic secretory protein-like protein, partial [Kiritimatiellaeota bacterium]|nr:basic secretory protein-like protein [Kiritimatiellota bacterium]